MSGIAVPSRGRRFAHVAGLALALALVAAACGGSSHPKPTATPAFGTPTTTRPSASTSPTVPTPSALRTIALDASAHTQPPTTTVHIGQPPTSPFPMPPDGHTVIYDTQTDHETDLGTGAQPASFSPDSTKAVWSQGEPNAGTQIALIDLATGAISALGAGRTARFIDDTHVAIATGSDTCQSLELATNTRTTTPLANCGYGGWARPPVQPQYSLQALPLTGSGRGQIATYRFDVIEVATGRDLLRLDGTVAALAGNGQLVAGAPPVNGNSNLYVVDIATGTATFVASALNPFTVDANPDRILWSEDFCNPVSPGMVAVYDRHSHELANLDDGASDYQTAYSLRAVRFTPSGLIAGGPSAPFYLLDPNTWKYVTVVPAATSWSPDWRYASSGYVGGHGGLCDG